MQKDMNKDKTEIKRVHIGYVCGQNLHLWTELTLQLGHQLELKGQPNNALQSSGALIFLMKM